jgi:hypothetical protein
MAASSPTSFAPACGVSAPWASAAATSVAAQPDPGRWPAGIAEHGVVAGVGGSMPANASTSTLFSAAAFAVAATDSTDGTSAPTIVPRNTASTRPRTARNAALGLSASRRVASSGEAPLNTRAHHRAAAAVSHGPAITSPTMTMSRPG